MVYCCDPLPKRRGTDPQEETPCSAKKIKPTETCLWFIVATLCSNAGVRIHRKRRHALLKKIKHPVRASHANKIRMMARLVQLRTPITLENQLKSHPVYGLIGRQLNDVTDSQRD